MRVGVQLVIRILRTDLWMNVSPLHVNILEQAPILGDESLCMIEERRARALGISVPLQTGLK